MRLLIADGRAQWQELDRRIAGFDAEFATFTKENEDAERLATIPGVGVMIASALTSAIGKAEAFEHGRDLAAWRGLVRRQSTTGGKPKLFGISKRGNKYLRKLLIHGARSLASRRRARHGAGWRGQGLARARASECRRCGFGQQASADRVGGVATRRNISPSRERSWRHRHWLIGARDADRPTTFAGG